MFVITGKSCSGKNAVAAELEKRGYHRCVTYTTRPMRPGEVDGESYHFVTPETFESLVESGFFAEHKKYVTDAGVWYYGSAAADFVGNDPMKFIILTPEGVRDVRRNTGVDPLVIYLFANIETIRKRLKARGDSPEEAKRRMDQDIKDFNGFQMEADRIIYNNWDYDICGVADKIENFLKMNAAK